LPYRSTRTWTYHRPLEHLIADYGVTDAPPDPADAELISRIVAAYTKAVQTDIGVNFWVTVFGPANRLIHDALMSGGGQPLAQLLRNPAGNMLFYGFETLYKDAAKDEPSRKAYASLIFDSLLALCEAVGAKPLEYPEGYELDNDPPSPAAVEPLLSALDQVFGFPIDFPNPYPEEVGLVTSRGVAGYRAIQSVYQGYRIAELARSVPGPVVEIGGGLGRTAYYSTRFGVKDYTIVDIPMSAVAQAYFLGQTLGGAALNLYEEPRAPGIKLIPPEAFFLEDRQYGLLVSVDSMPEIQQELVSRYLASAASRCARFLSINHETFVPWTVREMALQHGFESVSRHPYWMRRGYVEELFEAPRKTAEGSRWRLRSHPRERTTLASILRVLRRKVEG
jgi:hypothetical protein